MKDSQGMLDLSMLRAFHRIYLDRSVTEAALKLGTTQSAISHVLRRLRLTFGDELFIRAKNGFVPTARAESLFPSVEKILVIVERELVPEAHFDPEMSKRSFRLSMNDLTQVIFFKTLLPYCAKHARGCSFSSRHIADDRVASALETDIIDLAIGSFTSVPPGYYQQALYNTDYTVLVSDTHPRIRGRITWADFSREDHLVVSSASDTQFQTATLSRLGIDRRVRLTVEGFLAVPWLLRGTDLIATVPTQISHTIAKAASVVQLPLPEPVSSRFLQSVWHPRMHNDPAHRWLRSTLFSLVRGSIAAW